MSAPIGKHLLLVIAADARTGSRSVSNSLDDNALPAGDLCPVPAASLRQLHLRQASTQASLHGYADLRTIGQRWSETGHPHRV